MPNDTVMAIEMPKYKCHKEVWALKISAIEFEEDGRAKVAFTDSAYAPVLSPQGYRERFKGSEEDLGYYVVYEGGYVSWSPTEAFESGYSLIEK